MRHALPLGACAFLEHGDNSWDDSPYVWFGAWLPCVESCPSLSPSPVARGGLSSFVSYFERGEGMYLFYHWVGPKVWFCTGQETLGIGWVDCLWWHHPYGGTCCFSHLLMYTIKRQKYSPLLLIQMSYCPHCHHLPWMNSSWPPLSAPHALHCSVAAGSTPPLCPCPPPP